MANRQHENAKLWAALVLFFVPAVPFQGYFCAVEHTDAVTYWCLANFALTPFLLFALLGLHQAVMAATAYLLGDRVTAITIGIGPKLWPRGSRPAKFVIRLFPVTYMHAILTPRAEGQRRRSALIYLAGALVMLALAVLPFVCESSGWRSMRAELGHRLAPDIMGVFFAPLLVYYSLVALIGLAGIPGFGISPTILQARRIRGAALFASLASKRLAHRDALAIARRGLEDAPKDELLGLFVGELLVTLRDPTALDTLSELKQRESTAMFFRQGVANLWAWEAYMRDDQTLRDEACDLVERIVGGLPDGDLSLIDTHAHMLLWSGRDGVAEPKFVRVESTATRASLRASSACGLAKLHARRGDYATARRWLARARELHPTNMLIAPTAQLVEAPGTERI